MLKRMMRLISSSANRIRHCEIKLEILDNELSIALVQQDTERACNLLKQIQDELDSPLWVELQQSVSGRWHNGIERDPSLGYSALTLCGSLETDTVAHMLTSLLLCAALPKSTLLVRCDSKIKQYLLDLEASPDPILSRNPLIIFVSVNSGEHRQLVEKLSSCLHEPNCDYNIPEPMCV